MAKKLALNGIPGMFNAPVAIETYAKVFEEEGALDKLEAFASLNGPRHYKLPPNEERITLEKVVLDRAGGDQGRGPGRKALVYRGGETIEWRVVMTAPKTIRTDVSVGGTMSDYDVIVVGGGNAAFCAALAAQEQGAKVLVLEAAPEDEAGGNSRFTAGSIRVVYNGVDDIKTLMPDLTEAEIDTTDFGTYTAGPVLRRHGAGDAEPRRSRPGRAPGHAAASTR